MRGRTTRGLPKGVHLICKSCAPKPDPAFAEKPLDWFIGGDVKKTFVALPVEGIQHGGQEHMWVHVADADHVNGVLRGWLVNEPVLPIEGGVMQGSVVTVSRDEIAFVEPCHCDRNWLARRRMLATLPATLH